MNESVRTTEPDVTQELQHVFVTSSSKASLVKSVRTDFKDVPDYFSAQYGGADIVRMEYTLSTYAQPEPTHIFQLLPIDCCMLQISIPSLPSAPYSLHINGINAMSARANVFNMTKHAVDRPDSILDAHASLSRQHTEKKHIAHVPAEPFIHSRAFDDYRIFSSKNNTLPDYIPVEITGYFDGASTVETRTMRIYSRDTYQVCLNGPTDHIVIKYQRQGERPDPQIRLQIDLETISINPCKDEGIIVVKLQDLNGHTHNKDGHCAMSQWLTPEQRESTVNMSRIDHMSLTGIGYRVEQVSQCRYEVYTLPHRSGETVTPGVHSGALVPRYFP